MVKDGFTLVEMLIVIAVIALLLVSITPMALNAASKSRTTRVVMSLKTISTGVITYFLTDGPSLPDASLSNLGDSVTLERVRERYFINGDVSDYSLEWVDDDLTDNNAEFCVVYRGGELEAGKAESFFAGLYWWSDTEQDYSTEPDATHSIPAYCARVEKFW